MLGLKSICYNGMKAEWDAISQRAEEWWLHAYSSGNWGAPQFKWLWLDSMAGDFKLSLLWQLIALFDVVFSSHDLSRFSLFELHSWWNLVNIIHFQRWILAAQRNQLVRIEFSRHSKHWELRPLSVSEVHGWEGVAGHLAESLNIICLWNSHSGAPALLIESEHAEAILEFESIDPITLLSQYRVKWGY